MSWTCLLGGDTRLPNPAVRQFILCPVCVSLLALNLQRQIGAAQRFRAGSPVPPGQDLLIQLSVLSKMEPNESSL